MYDILALPIHEIHGNNSHNKIEILLNEIDHENWTYRRNLSIQYPINKALIESTLGIPIFCPEIVLLYKSKSPREKDDRDFLAALPKMDKNRLDWLRESIKHTQGANHKWLELLV